MADPLSIVAGVVGIIGFGVQIAQILQKEIDETTTATERVEQIVIEIRATATGLTNLKDFLLEDANATDGQIFNHDGHLEVTHIVRHCNTVFRNITVLVAKAGSGVLSQVDLYQRKVEEEHKKRNPTEELDADIKLEIELSKLEHLMWPWRLPKIQQYLADMDRLKLSLVLILSVANLAKTRRQKTVKAIKAGTSDTESDKWDGSDAETLVQDEIFYQDQGLREAEQKLKSLTIGPSAPDAATRSQQSAARLLIQSWPNSPSGHGLCSISEIHDAGVILESHAFNFQGIDGTIDELPHNFQTIQQHALRRRHWGSKKPCDVWERFAGLPTYQQEAVLEFISRRKARLYGRSRPTSSQNSQLILLSVYRDNFRWRRTFEAFKRFLTMDVSGAWGRYILFIVIARLENDPGLAENSWDSDSQEIDFSSDSSYSSDAYAPRRSRSRYRRRRSRNRSSSLSRSRSKRRSIAGAALAKFFQRRLEKSRRLERSRSRARRSSYTYDDAYYTEPYLPEPHPRPPQRTRTDKTRSSDEDVPDLHRVETLKERENELRPPSQKATEDDGVQNVPMTGIFPSKRRTTTFKPTTEEITEPPDRVKSALENSLNIGAKSRTGTGKLSEIPEPGISRRDTTKRSSHGWGLLHRSRTARSRSRSRSRDQSRGRSRSGSIEIVRRRRRSRSGSRSIDRSRRLPFIRRTRSRSRRGYYESPSVVYVDETRKSRPSRRSHREASSGMQLLTSSPTRPIIRTFEDDGIPPTQRDKAAVADYYLRKWTTAYENGRGGMLYRPRQHSRSRTMRRGSYTRNPPGLIEYGSDPVYGDKDATVGKSDKYYPYSNYFPPPPQPKGYDYQQKSPEDATGKDKDVQDEERGKKAKERGPAAGTDKDLAEVTKTLTKPTLQEVGGEEEAGVENNKDKDKTYTLEIPRKDRRAYVESVSDLETGLAKHESPPKSDHDSDEHLGYIRYLESPGIESTRIRPTYRLGEARKSKEV